MKPAKAVTAVRQASKSRKPLTVSDLTTTNGTANKESLIAQTKLQMPVVLDTARALRLAVTAYDSFQTDGSGGDAETFNLSQSIVDTPNTDALALYEGGNVVQPDSVDYHANSVTYTDDGTNNVLHAFYVSDDPVEVTIKKRAPVGAGEVADPVFTAQLASAHIREQFKSGGQLSWDVPAEVSGRDETALLKGVVPEKWTLEMYASGGYGVTWDDSDDSANGSDGTTASNALVTLPVAELGSRISGLGSAVQQQILNPEG